MVQENITIAIIIIVLFILIFGVAALIWAYTHQVLFFAKKEPITDDELGSDGD